jgi:hypothetical protein
MMLGKVYSLETTAKGYKSLIIETRTPFKTKWKKYNLLRYNLIKTALGTEAVPGLTVKFTDVPGKEIPELFAIEVCFVGECEFCRTFFEAGDAQQMDCMGGCEQMEKFDYVDEILECCHKKDKKYTFSIGTAITFINKDDTCSWSTCLFDNNALKPSLLEVKKYYRVQGWVTSVTDEGLQGKKCLVSLTSQPAPV